MVIFEIVLDDEGVLPPWKKPVTSKYGLYVFVSGVEIMRIGESSSGCDRIVKGFRQSLRHIRRGKERKNYLAYSWRVHQAGQPIQIIYFNLDDEPFADNHLRRALEAEITFQVRFHTGHWPRFMSEIHFLECHREHPDVVREASRVLSHFGFNYRPDERNAT